MSEEKKPEEQKPEEQKAASKLVGMKELRAGYVVRVYEKIKDESAKGEERERVQIFEGMVIGVRGSKATSKTVTIRKVSEGYGVEKIYPLASPLIEKIELVKMMKVRRAKLHYLSDPKSPFRRVLKEEKAS